MPWIDVSWDASKAEEKVARTLTRMSDLSGILPAIGERMRSGILFNFREGRAPDGTPWKPSQRVLKHGGQTLVDTGRLRNSIMYAVTGTKEVRVGTSVVYAAIHNFGGMAGRGRKVHIPQREFMGLRKDDVAEIERMVKGFFEEA